MAAEVIVTRNDSASLPIALQRKYKITEGTHLKVVDTGKGILFEKVPSTLDLIGSGASVATVREMKRRLDEMRAKKIEWNELSCAEVLEGRSFQSLFL